jgi:transketolase
VRHAFISGLVEIAERDPRVMLLTADLGYTVIEQFADRFPSRFLNVGVAEQNMVGVATGLAASGFVPFVYSIVPFAVLRPYEAIRNGPVFHHLPVRIVGVGGGIEYGFNGPSHFGLEDLAVMRAQPGLHVIAPADGAQARQALAATWHLPAPIYYRLGKDERAVVPGLDGRFELGRTAVIGGGADLLLVVTGAIAVEARAALSSLEEVGIHATLAVAASLAPAPTEDLAEALARFANVMTIESHYAVGGLGSLVAEIIAERGLRCRLTRAAIHGRVTGALGSERDLLERFGLSAQRLTAKAVEIIRGSK